MKAGVTLVPVMSDNSNDFFKELKNKDVKAAIISPNKRVSGNLKQSEVLLHNIDELNKRNLFPDQDHRGSTLNLKDYPALKYIIHTGFYAIPGTYKFRVSRS